MCPLAILPRWQYFLIAFCKAWDCEFGFEGLFQSPDLRFYFVCRAHVANLRIGQFALDNLTKAPSVDTPELSERV